MDTDFLGAFFKTAMGFCQEMKGEMFGFWHFSVAL